MRGCGIRSLTMLAPIAYCACFIESAEVMLDGSVGVVAAGGGFFDMLAPTFGVGAFDVGGHRFATYVQGVTPSAASTTMSSPSSSMRESTFVVCGRPTPSMIVTSVKVPPMSKPTRMEELARLIFPAQPR